MKIVVVGPPCSGKTTISMAVADHYPSIHRLSCRAMCQSARDSGTPDGLHWAELESTQTPFPAGLTDRIAAPYLKAAQQFVIDGYPKTLDEVDFFFKEVGRPSHLLVVYESEVELLNRAQNRLECPVCMRPFTRSTEWCPSCGVPGRTRAEDSPRMVQRRLAEYRSKSALSLPRLREIAEVTIVGTSHELCGNVPQLRSTTRLAEPLDS